MTFPNYYRNVNKMLQLEDLFYLVCSVKDCTILPYVQEFVNHECGLRNRT